MQTTLFFALLAQILALSSAASCDSAKKEKDCLATPECAWCSSAAVGSTCFSEADAKTLPSSIYECEFQDMLKSRMAAATCDAAKKEKDCMATPECAWCSSAAVGSTCFSEADAKTLPSSVYDCEFQSMKKVAAATCDAAKKEKDCMATPECAWCSSAAVGATCFNEDDAKTLPSSVYDCEFQSMKKFAAATCDAAKKEKDCMATPECAWCSSAAVGATCFNEDDAKTLPSSVYDCEFQSMKKVAAATCDGAKKEKDCLSTTLDNGEKCAWCSSAAVGATCFSETDAKSLPSSIYACEYQVAYSLRGAAH